jgi:hypothetical protein
MAERDPLDALDRMNAEDAAAASERGDTVPPPKPDIGKSARSKAPKPAEIWDSDGPEPGTRAANATRSTRSGPAAAAPAGNGADSGPDTGAAGPSANNAPDGATAEQEHGYQMTPKGLFFVPKATETNTKPSPIFVAAAFEVVGQSRSDTGDAWGVLLRWRDRENRPHEWAIPRRLVHRAENEIAEELEHAGLHCGLDARAHDLLKRFISAVNPKRLLRCVARTGWHQAEGAPVFVLPGGEAFGRGAADFILQADAASNAAEAVHRYCAAGTLADWQTNVAAPAVGNDRLALSLSAAFAPPLLAACRT